MAEINAPHGLGALSLKNKVYLFYSTAKHSGFSFRVDQSDDGYNFHKFADNIELTNPNGSEEMANVSSFRIVKNKSEYFLTYLYRWQDHTYLRGAKSKNLKDWEVVGKLFPLTEPGVIVPDFKYKKESLLYYGGSSIKMATSTNLLQWNTSHKSVASPEPTYANRLHYLVGNAKNTPEGPLLTFFVRDTHDGHFHYSIWSILFDKKDPSKIIWQSDKALWYQPQEWIGQPVLPLGIIEKEDKLISYWEWQGKGIFSVSHTPHLEALQARTHVPHAFLQRLVKNPILSPRSDVLWESKQVFNPAAVHDEGKVHLFYRAIGEHDTSVLGYASSPDGLHFDERPNKPAYVPRAAFEHPEPGKKIKTSPFESGGGGYGGVEDPRITKIGKKFYLTYVAYDGRNPPRVALAAIDEKDFRDKNWENWGDPVLISPPGVVDKNACILPEKVNGKYVIFHRIFPDILVDFVDDLDFDGETKWLKGEFKIHPRANFWDSRKVGVGPPPIKTPEGWLTIYQAVGNQDPSKYKIGAMLLDLEDPTKVLYRSNQPVLEPVEHYENNGFKFGVVYPCGAAVVDENLIVYYGGADMFVAAAHANLEQFIDQLKYNGLPHLDPVNFG